VGEKSRAPLDPRRESPDAAGMARDNLVALLLRVPLFSGLKPLQLTEIVRRAERQSFWPGDLLTKAGQPGDGAYLIVSGPAERVAGPGVHAMPEPVVPGSLIGEMAMLVEHDYGSTIVARDRVCCLKLMRTEMHAQMREDATLTEHFRERVTERLMQTAEELRRMDDALAARNGVTLQPAPDKFPAATGWYR
jgi:signal-transduction protein with cAMP-binding, CBS, and nucleotidyltransferase domain